MSGSSAVPGYGYGIAEPNPDIVWLKLTEGSGTSAADTSGAGNNFTLNTLNGFWDWTTPGASGSGTCLRNTASSNNGGGHSTATINFGAANVITVCFWANFGDQAGAVDGLMFELSSNSNSTNHAFFIDCKQSTSVILLSIHDGTGSFQGTIPIPAQSAWHQYAVVLDNSTNTGVIKAYLDGTSQTVTNTLNTKSANGVFATDTLYFWSRAGTSLPVAASVDDIRIYSRELTNPEITTIVNDPK